MTAAPTPPSRDDNATTTAAAAGRPPVACPVCDTPFIPVRRQLYCSVACRKTAFRRRQPAPTAPTVPPRTPRRDVTVYECPSCEQRQLGQQRCPDCGLFGHTLGLAGTCPHCDGLIAAADLDPAP